MYTLHENIANYLPVLESCNLVFVTDNTFDFQLKKKNVVFTNCIDV